MACCGALRTKHARCGARKNMEKGTLRVCGGASLFAGSHGPLSAARPLCGAPVGSLVHKTLSGRVPAVVRSSLAEDGAEVRGLVEKSAGGRICRPCPATVQNVA